MAVPIFVPGQTNFANGSGTALVTSYPSGVGVHHSLIWVVSFQNTSSISSGPSDTLASSTTLLKSINNAGIGWVTNVYFVQDTGAAGGADTVTVNFAASIAADIEIFEYTGNPGTMTLVGSAIGQTGTNSSPTPGSITVTGTQQLIFTQFFGNNAVSYTIAAPFTARSNDSFDCAGADGQITNAPGVYTPQWSAPNANLWTSIGAAFQSTNNPSVLGGMPYAVSFPGY